ncbi:MAG: ABC transporter ATP-binding protein [Oscillospiraceae bacterium]|jgi:oligopeptide transport system ATP-binding protein|nr:ABC transporter ATP-binding protein [Oscillospiraceae bacterium]
MANDLLEIKNLRLSFFVPSGEVKAINNVSVSLKRGDVLGLVGESGSGKSVLSHAVMGFVSPPGKILGGSIDFNGLRINEMTEKEKRIIRGTEISMIFQDPMTSLNPVYPIGTQICEVLMLKNKMNRKTAWYKAEQLIKSVGIIDPQRRLTQYPHEFSGGMRQRIMIAIALACEPRLVIADEPTTALDVTTQAQILELMLEMKEKKGMAIIITTHNLGIVANMCDRIAVMYGGTIVEYGTVMDIFYESRHEYTKGLINSIPKLTAKKEEKLVPIEGTPLNMLVPPLGCPFAPRCKLCMAICLKKRPPYTQIASVHYSACWLNQKEEFERDAINV